MKTAGHWLISLGVAALIVLSANLHAEGHAMIIARFSWIICFVIAMVALMMLTRRRQKLAHAFLGVATGGLLSLGMAHHAIGDASSGVTNEANYRASAKTVDQNTRFDVVLLFPKGTSTIALEAFIQSTLKRVHVQACVHGLPCIARLLRLSEVGPLRKEIIAFDFMGDVPQFERAALLSQSTQHPLKPTLIESSSATDAALLF
jgi:hypothetical protein